jgi:predicted HicB family RNase H-like nuclease
MTIQHQINNFNNEVNEEIAFNIAYEEKCKKEGIEPYPKYEKKPYEKHRYEGGTRTPTRMEALRYKKSLKKI